MSNLDQRKKKAKPSHIKFKDEYNGAGETPSVAEDSGDEAPPTEATLTELVQLIRAENAVLRAEQAALRAELNKNGVKERGTARPASTAIDDGTPDVAGAEVQWRTAGATSIPCSDDTEREAWDPIFLRQMARTAQTKGRIKVKVPESFSGLPKQGDGDRVGPMILRWQTWRTAASACLRIEMKHNGVRLTGTDLSNYIATWLEGIALKFASATITTLIKASGSAEPHLLIAALAKQFGPSKVGSDIISEVEKVRQKAGQSVIEFTGEFTEAHSLLVEANIANVAWTQDLYLKALRPELRAEAEILLLGMALGRDSLPPNAVGECIALLRDVAQQAEKINSKKAAHAARHQRASLNAITAAQSPESGQKRDRRQQLTDWTQKLSKRFGIKHSVVSERLAGRHCIVCGKGEHMMRECPARKDRQPSVSTVHAAQIDNGSSSEDDESN